MPFCFSKIYGILILLSSQDPATGGGEILVRNYSFFSYLLHGRYSLPLYLQMARWR